MGRFFIGADENGMGPRLGPLVVTAVMAQVREGAERVLTQRPRGGLKQRLGDSKGLMAHGDIALGEAWSRALVEKGGGRHERVSSPAEVVDAISLDGRAELQLPCPSRTVAQCWNTKAEAFVPSEAMGDTLIKVRQDLRRLAKRGVDVIAVRSIIVCPKRLNEAVDRGQSRFVVDLHAMERLILALQKEAHFIDTRAAADLYATCGKVGGYNQYGPVFGPLSHYLHTVLEEGRPRSAYRFAGVGEVEFVRDGDDSHILVGLASLVGKYLRELLMQRVVAYYQQFDPSLPNVSGYHDPTTRKFVIATETLRHKRRVPDRCFERNSIGKR
ncbi:MAG: hypothetical protein AAGA56_15495 [Myxococcota bacterium]